MWFSCGVKLKDPFSSGPVPLQRCLFPNKSERWQRRGFDFVGFIYWLFWGFFPLLLKKKNLQDQELFLFIIVIICHVFKEQSGGSSA